VFIFLLCGCNEDAKTVTIQKYFSSNIYVSTESINFSGNFNYNKNGVMTLTVTTPKDLQGYKYVVKNGEVTMTYQGITSKSKIENFPQNAPVKILWHLMEELEENSPNLHYQEKDYTATINNCTVNISKKGKLTSLEQDKVYISFVETSKNKQE
jgi:hypothetical protein